jgi:hypothetical protein
MVLVKIVYMPNRVILNGLMVLEVQGLPVPVPEGEVGLEKQGWVLLDLD